MNNFILLCNLIEPAKRAGYWLSLRRTNGGTCVDLYPHSEHIEEVVYSILNAKEDELDKAVVAVRGFIEAPTPLFPNGEHIEYRGMNLVISGDWRNGTMIVTSEDDIFELLSDKQLNEIMEGLV